MKTVICPNCKGKKYVYDHVAGFFTFGLAYLMDRDLKCNTCNGKGYITIPN